MDGGVILRNMFLWYIFIKYECKTEDLLLSFYLNRYISLYIGKLQVCNNPENWNGGNVYFCISGNSNIQGKSKSFLISNYHFIKPKLDFEDKKSNSYPRIRCWHDNVNNASWSLYLLLTKILTAVKKTCWSLSLTTSPLSLVLRSSNSFLEFLWLRIRILK